MVQTELDEAARFLVYEKVGHQVGHIIAGQDQNVLLQLRRVPLVRETGNRHMEGAFPAQTRREIRLIHHQFVAPAARHNVVGGPEQVLGRLLAPPHLQRRLLFVFAKYF